MPTRASRASTTRSRALSARRKHARNAVPTEIEQLRGLADDNLIEYVKELAERGVAVRTSSPPPSDGLNTRHHQSLEEHLIEAFHLVWEDFARGGALILSEEVVEALGDINTAPLENFPAPAEEEHGGTVFRDKAAGGLEKHLALLPW